MIGTGCAVGLVLYIAQEGGELFRNAEVKLMQRIRKATGDTWDKSFQYLPTWVSGECVDVDFMFQLDRRLSLKQAHGMAFMVERRMRRAFPDSRDILIRAELDGN